LWLALLCLIYLAQCAWFLHTQSLTYDEPVHIAEGLDAWRHGRFEQYNDHPPLARLLCTLPLLAQKWQVEVQQLPKGFYVSVLDPSPGAMAWRARAVNVGLGLLLAVLLWYAAERFYSRSSAYFCLCLFVLSPALIAHFSVVTTDGAASLLIFATASQVVAWKRHPTWRNAVIMGLVLGFLLLAKFSTVLMFLLALLWMLVLGCEGIAFDPRNWNWRKAASAMAIAFMVVWAGYFFHVSRLSIHDGILVAHLPNWREEIVKPASVRLSFSLPVPAGEYVEGLREVARHNSHGQGAYFLGTVSRTGGWKLYHPVTALLKWPTVVLILVLLGLALVLRRKLRLSTDLWIMASFPIVYFAAAIFTRFNLGERHILPVYVFALFFIAGLWEAARPSRVLSALLISMVLLQAADTLRYAPAYLSYFNFCVRPQDSYKLLSGSNLDWGQGLLAVRDYERAHPGEQIWLAYFGSVDPALYGIKAKPLPENQRVTGTVIVGATNLSGEYLTDPNGYRWLLQHKPVATLDHALYVFKIDTP